MKQHLIYKQKHGLTAVWGDFVCYSSSLCERKRKSKKTENPTVGTFILDVTLQSMAVPSSVFKRGFSFKLFYFVLTRWE